MVVARRHIANPPAHDVWAVSLATGGVKRWERTHAGSTVPQDTAQGPPIEDRRARAVRCSLLVLSGIDLSPGQEAPLGLQSWHQTP